MGALGSYVVGAITEKRLQCKKYTPEGLCGEFSCRTYR